MRKKISGVDILLILTFIAIAGLGARAFAGGGNGWHQDGAAQEYVRYLEHRDVLHG